MMIVFNNTCPPFLKKAVTAELGEISMAYGIRWYYRGGGDLVSLKQQSKNLMEIYIPDVSELSSINGERLVKESIDEIQAEMSTLEIKFGECFLFDTKTKKILTRDSYIDFTPYYNLTRGLFIMVNEHGESNGTVWCVTDKTAYGQLNRVAMFMAKRELASPEKADFWSIDGKRLLSFLVAHRYGINVPFSTEHGIWSTAVYRFPKTRDTPSNVDLRTVNLDNIKKKLEKMMDTNPFVPNDVVDADVIEGSVLLSDILQVGVSSLYHGDCGVINVTIDIASDIYKMITLDSTSRTCLVALCNGVHKSVEEIKEELDADDVQLVSDDTIDGKEVTYG